MVRRCSTASPKPNYWQGLTGAPSLAERMVTQASPLARVLAFFDEFRAAPNDADIEVRIGSTEKGEAAVIISIDGKRHAFTTSEARKMAAIAEAAMRECPNDPASA